MPKAKAEAQYLLAMMTPLLEAGAELFLAGENRGGINGADKLLAPYGDKPVKRDSARRCSLYHGELSKPVAPFELDAWFGHYQCQAGDTELTVLALPGVFSASELDLGSQMLLASLPAMQGSLLDFGCGAGVIGSVLAKRNPELKVTMVDINALALESSRRTLAINSLQGEVRASDVYSDIQGKFDRIRLQPAVPRRSQDLLRSHRDLLGQGAGSSAVPGLADDSCQRLPAISAYTGDALQTD